MVSLAVTKICQCTNIDQSLYESCEESSDKGKQGVATTIFRGDSYSSVHRSLHTKTKKAAMSSLHIEAKTKNTFNYISITASVGQGRQVPTYGSLSSLFFFSASSAAGGFFLGRPRPFLGLSVSTAAGFLEARACFFGCGS